MSALAGIVAGAVIQRSFDAGQLPFLDVLDAQRTLFEFEQRYLDALVKYYTQQPRSSR